MNLLERKRRDFFNYWYYNLPLYWNTSWESLGTPPKTTSVYLGYPLSMICFLVSNLEWKCKIFDHKIQYNSDVFLSLRNSPPVALSAEEQDFVFSSLQCALHFLDAGGEAELLYAAGSHNILPCVHPESGPWERETIVMSVNLLFCSTAIGLHGDIRIPEKK